MTHSTFSLVLLIVQSAALIIMSITGSLLFGFLAGFACGLGIYHHRETLAKMWREWNSIR